MHWVKKTPVFRKVRGTLRQHVGQDSTNKCFVVQHNEHKEQIYTSVARRSVILRGATVKQLHRIYVT